MVLSRGGSVTYHDPDTKCEHRSIVQHRSSKTGRVSVSIAVFSASLFMAHWFDIQGPTAKPSNEREKRRKEKQKKTGSFSKRHVLLV